MPIWLKTTIQYALSLAVGGTFLYFTFKGIDISLLIENIKEADPTWIVVSFTIALFSHYVRAYRWNLLMEPVGLKPALINSFVAVMVGYLANIVFPRMGEVSRCVILQKTDKIPVNTSFGTVVTERIFDLITLLSILFITLILEFDKLSALLFGFFNEKFSGNGSGSTLGYIGIGSLLLIILLGFISLRLIQTRFSQAPLILKVKTFLRGLLEGAMSFKKLKKKKEFIISTLLIWICYYYMSYVVFFSLDTTSELGFVAGLAVLVLGGVGMSAPSPGGIGTYHAIISQGLILYGLSEAEGLVYATIVHSSQMLMIISVGLISLFSALFFIKKKNGNESIGIEEKFRQDIKA